MIYSALDPLDGVAKLSLPRSADRDGSGAAVVFAEVSPRLAFTVASVCGRGTHAYSRGCFAGGGGGGDVMRLCRVGRASRASHRGFGVPAMVRA